MFIYTTGYYDCDVAKIESGSSDVEDRNDSLARTESDEIQACAKAYDKPDSINRGRSVSIDFVPDTAFSWLDKI
jgi:hypothetical protein